MCNLSAATQNFGVAMNLYGPSTTINAANLQLGPGESVLLDLDMLEPDGQETGLWNVAYGSSAALAGSFSVHTTVFEYASGGLAYDSAMHETFSGSGHAVTTHTGSISMTLGEIPEPSALALGALAAAPMLVRRRRG